MNNKNSDVLVIGAGLAGIVATICLIERGKKVILVDRDKQENMGGLAKESFGGVTMVNTPHQQRMKICDSPELAHEDWLRTAEFTSQDQWPRQWAKHYVENSHRDIFEWLDQRGIKFFPVVHWVERGLFQPGNSVPRFHMVWGTGKGLIDGLVSYLYSHRQFSSVKTVFNYEVKELLQQHGRIVGCRGLHTSEKREEVFSAENVIVAAGGICGDLNLVRKHWPKERGTPPETLLNGSHRYADGQLHQQLQNHNAKATHLDLHWHYAAGVNHPRPNKQHHGLSLVPPKGALWLNWKGERMGPLPLVTGFDTRHLVDVICQQERKYSWQILNYKIALKELAVSGSEYNDGIRDKKIVQFLWSILFGNKKLVDDMINRCPDFVVANSLKELVQKMNERQGDQAVSFETVQKEVKYWDEMVKRGEAFHTDDQLRRIHMLRKYRGDKLRTSPKPIINDTSKGPLIAIREFILTRKSLGGIQTNLNSQVLDNDGVVIPGVFAVGETAGFGGGGIHGNGCLEGTFLGSCVLTAQRAAESILKGN